MNRPGGPRAPVLPGGGTGAWTVLAAAAGLAALAWLAWLAARAAAAISGGHVPGFGAAWILLVMRGRTAQAWPGTSTPLVAAAGAILAAVAAAAGAGVWRIIGPRLPRPGDPVAALARNPQITDLAGQRAAGNAIRLRPSLAGTSPRRLAPADTGLLLGHLMLPSRRGGPALYASWEDTTIAVMAPRSGKTTALAIPWVLSAPGPVAATSVRADLWAATSQLRAQAGTVRVFDPGQVTGTARSWWWNPLAGLTGKEAATRLAAHFVVFVEDEHRRDIWGPAAKDLLCALFLAAGSSGRTLRDVGRWLADPASPLPADLLARAGMAGLGASLRGMQHGAPETRDGIYQTARTAAACLTDEDILPWVTPPRNGPPLPAFGPEAFAGSRDTLYLVTEAGTAAAPLIAALADAVMRAGRRRAERCGGRLDPPMVTVLDEAANICRIADLPALYSHAGGRGIVPVTILQSYEQGEAVWGQHGMAALWGAATKKLIGAGTDSPRLARDIAALTGQHDVPVRSVSYGDGRASVQVSLRRQDILEPADIRALPPGTALLLATGARAALIRLRPWYAGPDAARIAAATARAEESIRQAAAYGGPGLAAGRGAPGGREIVDD